MVATGQLGAFIVNFTELKKTAVAGQVEPPLAQLAPVNCLGLYKHIDSTKYVFIVGGCYKNINMVRNYKKKTDRGKVSKES